ncbi:MAG: DinB family protein [Ilumatobacter sp.]|jgi:hypothetical protein|uniref:DinB family protein n=1 Tax=Ilumatobacter sp. TaxID=1967498 RepID=UPI00391B9C82
MNGHAIPDLLREFDRAVAYSDSLWHDLTLDEVRWRPSSDFSPIGWHLGHQAAVAHYLVRNLVAAEPSLDPDLDALMDSITPEPGRGALPTLERLRDYRHASAERVRIRVEQIRSGDVGAPAQLAHIAVGMITAIINHEYQHGQWIGEVRAHHLGKALPDRPTSDVLIEIDGYLVVS